MPRGRALLITSAVLNIFLLGAIAGGLWRWTHGEAPPTGWRAHAVASLPPPQATALRQVLRETRAAARPTLREAHDARTEAARLFTAQRFDAAATLAALDRARAADAAVRTRLEHRIVAFAATLPPEQRRVLAEALHRGPLHEGRRTATSEPAPAPGAAS